MNPSGRQIANKWVKTRVLIGDDRVSRFIPETRLFNPQSLKEMLSKYNMIVLKPSVGTGGHGLIRINRLGESYSCHYKEKIQQFSGFGALATFVKHQIRNRNYIIQQGIHLAKIEGRPLDYRVKIVKRKEKWIITAIVGRLARKGLFVTNLCKGGTQFTFHQAIQQSLPRIDGRLKKEELKKLTRLCTHMLENVFPGINQLGFDYGLDLEGNIWMFEVNTNPWGLPSSES